MKKILPIARLSTIVTVLGCVLCHAQQRPVQAPNAEVRLHLVSSSPGKAHAVPEVLWLKALPGTPALSFPAHNPYILLQKKRMFTPHLLVIPVGSAVQFPNQDTFFHNVFSLFDGKRFDLGLYEAGSSKSVTFSREGISYIFCNIHPEMSAVIVSLSTPLFATGDARNAFAMQNVPPGNYELHLWIEGVSASTLAHLTRNIHVQPGVNDLGEVTAPIPASGAGAHTNMFGMNPDKEGHPIY